MTADPRAELRRRIAARLSNDEWMNEHFGIACHAHDVADAVLELFDDVRSEQVWEVAGTGPIPAGRTRLVVRTPAEVWP